ncbi:hypothetical protein JQC91_03790 [Jannaschia sp. Os4]|uniref:hypothetical protein n=1 Tax=Jannaschia sp. Os4 TaxID=2807617 RepID=UPI0019398816|nr:hypothetical protein [Jannaschia sp. Os4]MBM2575416.1 hypothetical protein [Jannaschia sp. Os4]
MTTAARRAPTTRPRCEVIALDAHRPAPPLRFDRAAVTAICDDAGRGAASLLGDMLSLVADRAELLRAAWEAEGPDRRAPRPAAGTAVADLRLAARTLGLVDLHAACGAVASCEGRGDRVARAACRARLLRHADVRAGRGWHAVDRPAPA